MSGAGRAGGAQGGHRRARGAPRRWPPPVSDSPEPRKSCTLSSPKKDVHEIVDVGLQEDKPGKQGVQISHMLSRFQDTTRGREALKNCPILSWGIKTPRTCSWGSSPRTPSCRSLPANTLPHDFAGGADLDRWWPQQSLRGLSMWTRVLLKILVHVDPAPVWAFFGRGPNGTMHVEKGGVHACV